MSVDSTRYHPLPSCKREPHVPSPEPIRGAGQMQGRKPCIAKVLLEQRELPLRPATHFAFVKQIQNGDALLAEVSENVAADLCIDCGIHAIIADETECDSTLNIENVGWRIEQYLLGQQLAA